MNNGLLHNMTDIHSHIMYGVDDGAKSEKQSLVLIDKLSQLGIVNSFVTPHIMSSFPLNTYDSLSDYFRDNFHAVKKSSNINMMLSGEYMVEKSTDELLQDVAISKQKLLTFDGKHILIEVPAKQEPTNFLDVIFKLQTLGYIPILAHPERYLYMTKDDISSLRDKGVKFQLNILALSKVYGELTNKNALLHLQNGIYDYIGTDIHNEKMCDAISTIDISSKLINKFVQLKENNTLLFNSACKR